MFKYKQTNRAINKNSELRSAAEELIHRTSLRVATRAQKRTVAESQPVLDVTKLQSTIKGIRKSQISGITMSK